MHYKVELDEAGDVCDPRGWDNLGKMVCWHRRYNLGDKNVSKQFSSPESFLEFKKENDLAICLPLYLLDHSEISISLGSFNDPWDSGQVGYIYCTHEDLKKEYSGHYPEEEWKKIGAERLEGEVADYDTYLRGEIYCYIVYDEVGEILDCCGGFFDEESATCEAESSLKYRMEELEKRKASLASRAKENDITFSVFGSTYTFSDIAGQFLFDANGIEDAEKKYALFTLGISFSKGKLTWQ